MSEAENTKVTEEQLPQEEDGNAEESNEESPQSTEGPSAAPGSTLCPDDEPKAKEDSAANPDGAAQVKMQSIFSQVRNQIRLQVGMDFHKKGILDVVQRVTRERARENSAQTPNQTKGTVEGESEAEEEGKEEEEGKSIEGENKAETAVEETLEGGLATLREELLASIETLRNDFREEMAILRAEAREYSDKAVKDLEAKVLGPGPDPQKCRLQRVNPSGQQLQPGANAQERLKSLSVPSLVPGRPRMLNRTMTTLNPKTCHSIVLGPRSKSETLRSPGENKGGVPLLESSDFHVFATQGKKRSKAGGNLPPACPTLRSNKKTVRSKVRMGNSTSI